MVENPGSSPLIYTSMRHIRLFESGRAGFRVVRGAAGVTPWVEDISRYEPASTEEEVREVALLLGPLGLDRPISHRGWHASHCVCRRWHLSNEFTEKVKGEYGDRCPAQMVARYRELDENTDLQAFVGKLQDDWFQLVVRVEYGGGSAMNWHTKTCMSRVMVCDGLDGLKAAVRWAASEFREPVESYSSLVDEREAAKARMVEIRNSIRDQISAESKKVAKANTKLADLRRKMGG